MRRLGGLAGILITVLAFLAGCDPRSRPLTSGIELTYQIDPGWPEFLPPTRAILTNRLEVHGLREFRVETREPDRVVVQLPGSADSFAKSRLKKLIEEPGTFSLVLVAKDEFQTEEKIESILEE